MTDPLDEKAMARVGTMLDDKWSLERLLGVGGMGAVYAAKHRNGARAAIKMLHPELSRHEEVRMRFQREGYAANSVEHEGAVKVLDDEIVKTGPDEGTAYIVMELLEGESLEDKLERGDTITEEEFLEVAEAVLGVLAAAHSHGVVHRDLKPENLFFAQRPDGGAPRIKVLDFGLARLLAGQAITTYGLALGTPSFMSPEQAAGRVGDIDGRTDLFSLAATGFRMVAGRRIHEGDNAVDLVTKMANVPPPKLRDVAPHASAPFARVIDRGLEFRREDRYPNAEVMREDVRRALGELRGGATVVELSSSELKSVAMEAPAPAVGPALGAPALPGAPVIGARRSKRGRVLLLVLPLVAVAVVGLGGAKLFLDHRARAQAALPAVSASASAAVAFEVQRVEPPPAPAAPPAESSAEAASSGASAPPPAASHVAVTAPHPRPPARKSPHIVHHLPRKHSR